MPRSLLAFCCSLVSALSLNQPTFAKTAEEGCHLKPTSTASITRIVDNQTVKLSDGTTLRIDGVLAPTALDSLTPDASWPPEREAVRALQDLGQNQSVGIATVGRSHDRYGRVKGHIFIGQGQQSRWLQAELVARGAVRVDVAALSPGCARLLLALEDRARRARAGLWAHAAYRVRDAAKPWRLLRYRSTYQIVEGRVHKVARVRKRIFINFDKNWRTDFTVGLTARIVRRLGLTAQQIDALEGQRVQVRGWIERRGGPFIFLSSRNQIRSIDEPRPPDKGLKSGDGQRPGPLAEWPSRIAPAPKEVTGSRRPSDDDHKKQVRPAVARPGGIDL